MTFEEMGLSPETLKAIKDLGFETPTPIQEQVIPLLLESKNDIVGLAQTGTGKTAAFGLPIIEKIDAGSRFPQALILCPTRELCLQIAEDIRDFLKYKHELKVLPVYGGTSIETQIRELKKGVHIVVATPGRMLDLLNRHCISVKEIDTLVLDEADEMLNMGFKEDIDSILETTPATKQTLLFSATMPKEVAIISKQYMNNPIEITVGKRNSGADNVRHIYYVVHSSDRYLALKRVLDFNPNIYGIVFCRTREETKTVADRLIQDGYNADALHGDLSQSQRDFVMNRYRTQMLQVLVATDVAARGIDVDNVTHVINYNLPDDPEIYTHRSGRTGRAGKSGISIVILGAKERNKIRDIERIVNKKFDYEKVPDGFRICEKQLFHMIDRMEKVDIDEEQISPYMEAVMRKLEWLDKEDLIKHFVSLEFNRFLNYYRNASDINAEDSVSRKKDRRDDDFDPRQDRSREERSPRQAEPGYARFFINVGRKDGINPGEMMSLINSATNDRDIRIGVIDLMGTYSFFEATEKDSAKILNSFHEISYKGREVRVELAGAAGSHGESDARPSRRRSSEGFSERRSGGDRDRDRGGERHGGYGSGGSRRSESTERRSERSDRSDRGERRERIGGSSSGGFSRRSEGGERRERTSGERHERNVGGYTRRSESGDRERRPRR